MLDSLLEKLKIYDDSNFRFESLQHRYTYENQKFISVTQFISRFHKKFDTEYWSNFKAKETGKPQEEILLEWKELNDRSLEIGTATHNYIEGYFKKVYQELPTDLDVIDRINKFNIVFAKNLYKLTPVKFEQRIFSKKWKIAGMIDSIFLYNGKIILIDYKTNKEFTTDLTKSYNSLLYPFESYKENHFNEYSIQVSLYKLILKEIGIDVAASYLLHIGPENEAKIHKALDFSKILEDHLSKEAIG